MSAQFDHEKLRAYQAAREFVAWVDPRLERLPAKIAVNEAGAGKELLLAVVSMAAGLIARFSSEVREEPALYRSSLENEND